MSQAPQKQLCQSCVRWAEAHNAGIDLCVLFRNGCMCFAMGHDSENCMEFHEHFVEEMKARISTWSNGESVCDTCSNTYLTSEGHQCICTNCRAHAENNDGECLFADAMGCHCGGYQHTASSCIQTHTAHYHEKVAAAPSPQVAPSGAQVPGQDQQPVHLGDSNTTDSIPALNKKKRRPCPWCLENDIRVSHTRDECPARGPACEECHHYLRAHSTGCSQRPCISCRDKGLDHNHKTVECPVAAEKKRKHLSDLDSKSTASGAASEVRVKNEDGTGARALSVNQGRKPSPTDSPSRQAAWNTSCGRDLITDFINKGIQMPDSLWNAFVAHEAKIWALRQAWNGN